MVREFSFRTSKQDREKDLREFIGHTPFQVFVGALLGIFIAWTWVILTG